MLMNVTTLFLPNFNNTCAAQSASKTTSVENELFYIINLITSFFAKGLLKLGNEVLTLLTFIRATEVVLLKKLGRNEVLLISSPNH